MRKAARYASSSALVPNCALMTISRSSPSARLATKAAEMIVAARRSEGRCMCADAAGRRTARSAGVRLIAAPGAALGEDALVMLAQFAHRNSLAALEILARDLPDG